MRGLLADVNVQGHLASLRRALADLDLLEILEAENLVLAAFTDIGIPVELDDRSVWNLCQQQGWVLFTENRNHNDPDSLEATLRDSWKAGDLPVITLSNKAKFETSLEYRRRAAASVADVMHGIASEEAGLVPIRYCLQPRIFVPA
jgi:hypothetical protein